MIEIRSIKVSTDVPGVAVKYLLEARFIDKSKGLKDTKFGPVLKWDKSLNISANTIKAGIERLEFYLSELFGEEEL